MEQIWHSRLVSQGFETASPNIAYFGMKIDQKILYYKLIRYKLSVPNSESVHSLFIIPLSNFLCLLSVQLRLADVEEVSLLTRKGYLTISLSSSKDCRILLRRHEGIRDWFNTLKVGISRNQYQYQSCISRRCWRVKPSKFTSSRI